MALSQALVARNYPPPPRVNISIPQALVARNYHPLFSNFLFTCIFSIKYLSCQYSYNLIVIYNLTPPPPPPSYIRHPGDVLGSPVGWASLTATSSLIKNYSITHYLYICMLFTSVTTHLHTLTYLNVFVWFLENREAPNIFIDKLNNRNISLYKNNQNKKCHYCRLWKI
jgi:hypothetical protein